MPAIGIATNQLEPIGINLNQIVNDLLHATEANEQLQAIPLIVNLRFNWTMLVSEVRNYLAFRKGSIIDEIRLFSAGVNQALESLAQMRNDMDADQEDLLEEFENKLLSYQTYLTQAIDIHAGNNWRADRELLRTSITPTLRKLTVELEALATKQQQRILESNVELSEQISNAEQIIHIFIQIALAIILLVIYLSFRNKRLASDIHDHKESERKMHYKAHHDALTSLANRAFFDDKLFELFLRQDAASDDQEKDSVEFFGLLYIDLDGFKAVNDKVGHDAGDFILIEAAKRMQNAVRSSDTVCRLGGDEFSVLLQGEMALSKIEAVAEKICKVISVEYNFNGKILNVSASTGVSYSTHPDLAQYQSVSDRMDALIKQADQAMYQAKKNGKNQIYRFQ